MSDFHVSVGLDRDQIVAMLTENPEQLAYVLIELAEKLPGTWAMEDLLEHLGDTDSPSRHADAAAFFQQVTDRLMGIEHK